MSSSASRFFVLLFSVLIASPSIGFSENHYKSPNFLIELAGIGELSEENEIIGDIIVKHLVGFAVNLEGDPETQSKALALAWHCNKKTRPLVIEADFYLRLGEFPEDSRTFADVPSEEALAASAEKLLSYAKRLGETSNETEKNLAAFTFDLLQSVLVEPTVRANARSATRLLPNPSWAAVPVAKVSSEKDEKFGKRQSLIKGLLVVDLGASEYAGQASQMNATLVDGSITDSPTKISFNQEVGESMKSALEEVQKFLSVRHDGIPPGKKIEIAFEEQYSSKDGPSAAVACTLLIDSLITGDEYDTSFAVTGDMNADGSIQPVGGIDGKIRGATKRNCTHVAIPKINVGLLSDMLVADDIQPLIAIQVFSIKKFEDAHALALATDTRDPKIKEAMEIFAEVQKVLLAPNGASLLNNSHVKGRLQKVVKAAPNHESARLLLLKGSGEIPNQLSLKGSFSQIDKVTKPIWSVLKTGELDNSENGLNDSIFSLRRVRSKLDDRAKPTADALEDLSKTLEALGASKLGNRSVRYRNLLVKFKAALSLVQTEYNKLASNPEVQEELIE